MNRWRWWPLLFLALVAFLPLAKPLFKGETIGAFDQIQQMAPWNGPKPTQPWDVLQADSVLQFYGWRDLVLTSWGKRELPLWNPHQLCGTPLLANSQSAGFYPPHIIAGLLHVPTGLAIVLLAWFHLFWAGLGVYTLSRRLGASRVGGVIAGSSFSMSAFMLAWLALPSVVSTVAWIPWVLSGVLALWEPRPFKAVALLALSTAMMVLAGHLQFVAYGLMAAFIVLAVKGIGTIKEKAVWARLGGAIGGLALGLLMAAPQLFPVLAYSKDSHRQNVPTEQGYAAYIGSAIPPSQFLARLANPFSQGNPTQFAAEGSEITSYWPSLSRPGDNFAESAATLGPLVLGLLIVPLGLLLIRKKWGTSSSSLAMGIVALVAFLLAVGSPLNRLLYFAVPGWSASGSPGRVVVIFILALCTLAGLAASQPIELTKKQLLLICAGGFVLVGITFSLAMQTGAAPEGVDSNMWTALTQVASKSNVSFFLLYSVVPIVVILLLQRRLYWLVALLPLTLAVHWIGTGIIRSGDPKPILPVGLVTQERTAFINDDWGLNGAAHALMPPNTATICRNYDVAGYDSLLARSTVESLRQINGQDPAPPANGNIMFIKSKSDMKTLAESGVSQIESLKPIPQLGEAPEPREGVYRYDLPSSGRAYTERGKAEITYDGLDRQRVTAQGPGNLVVKDRNFPGWSAKVDGKPVELKGTMWREVELSDGKHTIEFRYDPPGLKTGFITGFIGWLLFVGLSLLGRSRN